MPASSASTLPKLNPYDVVEGMSTTYDVVHDCKVYFFFQMFFTLN